MKNTKDRILEKELLLKFKTIFEEFFIKRDNVKELILQEGNRIFFKEWWNYGMYELKWNIEDKDLTSFQIHIIKEKIGDSWNEDILLEIEDKINNKWHYNYSYKYQWYKFRINWSLWDDSQSYMRIRKIPKNIPSPLDLWIPEILREELKKYKNGWLIIVAAPPWSWKSTTIASVVNELIHNETVNLITLEDPIEFVYEKISHISAVEQREKGVVFDTYRTWIEACMRQDPDIVVVQEMTTPEIIQDVMLLVEKWVMVITTLHTPDTTEIFESILSSYPEWKRKATILKLKDNFRLFISQRLVNKKDSKNQIAIFEVLKNTNDTKWYLADDSIRNIKQVMNKSPHLSFAKDIFNKINCGDISLETWLKFCPESRLRELKELCWID